MFPNVFVVFSIKNWKYFWEKCAWKQRQIHKSYLYIINNIYNLAGIVSKMVWMLFALLVLEKAIQSPFFFFFVIIFLTRINRNAECLFIQLIFVCLQAVQFDKNEKTRTFVFACANSMNRLAWKRVRTPFNSLAFIFEVGRLVTANHSKCMPCYLFECWMLSVECIETDNLNVCKSKMCINSFTWQHWKRVLISLCAKMALWHCVR